ncbi:XrtA system polysaccharide chain length determinant [Trichloromonas sp.]|uniref:XrtA system polysaccharide chain length determinant n=1 Tax=Trichloromonas sp. TaxID=3069249 RepID=UPI003D819471
MDSPILQIKKYLHALYSRRYLFLLIAASTAVLIVAGSFFVPEKYEAKSTVFIEKSIVNNLLKGLTVTPSMGDRIRVLRYEILSRDMILRVLKGLDMDVVAGTPEEFEKLIKYCQEETQISVKGDDLFFVSIVDPKPKFARDFINALVTTYVEENLSAKREDSFGANRFVSEQVTFYKDKLDVIEGRINQFRKETGIFSTVTEASIIEEIKVYEEELKGLRMRKNEMFATLKTIREQIKMMQQMASSGGALFDMSGVAGGDVRIGAIQAKIDELLLVYNEQYPTVVKLREQLAEMQKRQEKQAGQDSASMVDSFNPLEDPIFVDLKMRMNATQSDLNALEARENELVLQVDSNKRILANFPEDKKKLADMERERAMNRNVYETLLERVGISEVSKHMEVSDRSGNFRIVDPAILPFIPVGVKRVVMMVMGLFAGLGAGLGAVAILVKLDDTVKDSDALRALGVAVLAEIPLMHSEFEARLERKKDLAVYSYAGFCLFFVMAMVGHDLLGLQYVDQVIRHLRLDKLVADMVGLIS